MNKIVFCSDKAKVNWNSFSNFTQKLANRLAVGYFRYGAAHKSKLYLSRAIKELRAYKKSGNIEHLFNVANYCYLEIEYPEHKDSHFNAKSDSATRNDPMFKRDS